MSLIRRISNLFFRSKVDLEVEAELKSHIGMRIEDNIAAGMSPEDARRDALLRFGNPTTTKERVAGADAVLTLDGILSDIRYACRQLSKNPEFSCTAILVLALGISASVAIFAFVDAALIKPLPYLNPSRLVALFESTPLGPRFHLSYLDYLDWKRLNNVFSSVEAYDNNTFALSTATGAQQIDGATVSGGFFRALGIAPVLGRDFRADEDLASAPRTVMLSYDTWKNRYGGRQDILGQTITLDGASNIIIGVLPPGFHFVPAGPAEFWTALHASYNPEDRGAHGLLAIARLKDGVSPETASADMNSIARQLAKQYPDSDEGRGATVMALTDAIVGNIRPLLLLLLGGSALLLLIACVNVSSLLLVRTESRRREIAVRAALGASRVRLVRQFVTEGLSLVAAGSIIGVSAAYGAMLLLTRLIPANMLTNMPYLRGLRLNAHVMTFATAIACLSWLLFSVTPILLFSLSNPGDGLADGGRAAAGTLWRRLGANLVVLELCTAMILLVGAGLLGKSFYHLLHTDIGFQPDHLAMLRLTATRLGYPKDEHLVALAQHVMSEIARLPGVRSAAISRQLPVGGGGGNTAFQILGRAGNGEGNEANSRQVSANYFATVQARLLRGRYFDVGEDASKPRVAIVNQAFARKYFAGEDPVGKQIRYDESEPVIQIVGVVDDIKEGPLDATTDPALYALFNQEPHETFFVVVRTSQEPRALLATLVGTIHQIDPGIMTSGEETMVERINHSQSTYLHRSSAWVGGGFAAVALLLGMVGLYGVVAYSVSQRTREIGVRMALGAQRGSVYQLVLGEAGRLIAFGLVAGLICAVAAATLMRKLLFGTQPWDVPTLVAVATVLTVSALSASYIPARRAASVNPVEALRAD
jgi:macrolide transport system ATP-binding/permease protein